jgi:hypothetical protein
MSAQWIDRAEVSTDWALWVERGSGTHAILMDNDAGEPSAWIETDASTAATYARQYGQHRSRVIASVQHGASIFGRRMS